MSAKPDPEIKGTLIRGADGSIYFIPDENLDAFRVPEEHAGPVRESLAHVGSQSAEVKGYWAETGVIAIRGVTARRPWGLGPTIVPGIISRPR